MELGLALEDVQRRSGQAALLERFHQRQHEDSSLEFFDDGTVLGWKVSPIDRVGELAAEILDTMQAELFQRALDFRAAHSHVVDDYGEFKRILEGEGGFVYAHWNGKPET